MLLTLLATSDMHGYIEPTNYAQKEMDLPFGTARVYSAMEKIRQENKDKGPILTIENGDFIQGSPLSYYVAKNENHHVQELANITNAMGYDAGIIGNHEFNYGLDYLNEAIESYNYPILCANILGRDGKPYFGKPYEIFEKDGIKIALLGVTTPYIPHWEKVDTVKDLTFVSIVETCEKYIPELREKADVVVVSYHGGFEKDLQTGLPTEALTGENEGYELLEKVSGIDAFITGHQHREIADVLFGVPVIQPGYRGATLGVIQLEIEKVNGHVTVSNPQAKLIATKDFAPSEKITSLFATLTPEVENWLDQPLGKVKGDMLIHDPYNARLVEHPYIEFVNRVQMDATNTTISGTALFNNEGTGFSPLITMRDVLTNYIYPNTLAVLKVTGQDLKDALERTATYLQVDQENKKIIFNPKYVNPKPQFYNYDMYEGIEYTLDLLQPEGQRVTELLYEGKPMPLEDSYEVVLNQYRAVGGGNYTMFTPDKILREVQIDMTELIADYLKKNPVIEATVNHNFTILPPYTF